MQPSLSFVAVSRNDDHGGDMMKRMTIFMKGLRYQANAFQLPVELVMVEWNPLPEKPRLHEVLPNPGEQDYLQVRYVTVPHELHEPIDFSDRIPLFQMIGKNVGIRRAKAEWVVCTNVDLLFSNELFAFLAANKFDKQMFYRANRCDIPQTLDENWTFAQQIQFARRNIKKRLGKNPLFPNLQHTESKVFHYRLFQLLAAGYAGLKSKMSEPVKELMNRLDTDACGDFTMMSKEAWLAINGYPELEIYSLHIDSMALYAAAAKGYQQKVMSPNKCTYHMEHTSGWNFDSALERIQFIINRPMLDWETVDMLGRELLESGKTYDINSSNWGFADKDLEEVVYNFSIA